MSRARRAQLNFIASGFATIASVGVGFITTPLLLRWLGEERLGAFRVAQDWAGYLTLFETGISGALGAFVAQALAANSQVELHNTLAAGFRAYLRVAFWSLLAGTGLTIAIPYLVGVPPGLRVELWIGFAIGLLPVALWPLNVYRSLAEASQRAYLVSGLLTIQGILIAVATAAAAYAGWGLVGQFAAMAFFNLFMILGLIIYFHRQTPPLALLRSANDTSDLVPRLRRLQRLTLLQALCGRVCLLSDNIVIGLFYGAHAAVPFFLTQRLVMMAGGQAQSIGSATWAGLAELRLSGQSDLFRQRLRELTKFTSAFACLIILPLAPLSKPFVVLWIGSDMYAGDVVAAVAALNAVLLAVYSLWGFVFAGAGLVARLLPSGILSALLNLGFSCLFTWQFGLPGPLLGTGVVYLGYTSWKLPLLLHEVFGISPRELLLSAIGPLVPAAVVLAGLYCIRAMWPQYTWGRLAFEFFAAAFVYLAIIWRLVLANHERAMFRRILNRAGRRRED